MSHNGDSNNPHLDKEQLEGYDESEDLEVWEDADSINGETAPEIKKLKDQLRLCRKERREFLDGWQRERAELVNLRKKDELEKLEFKKYAAEDVLAQLIQILDSFEMAFADKNAWESAPSEWRAGMEQIYSQLVSVMNANGVSEINPKGERFSPSEHECVQVEAVSEKERDQIVTEVAQKGYRLLDKVLRPARVKVGEYDGDE